MIPLKISNVKLSTRWPSKIVLHHTGEQLTDKSFFTYDKPDFQSGRYQDTLFMTDGQPITGYHIIVERVKNDFHPIISQPLFTLCEWDDLDVSLHSALHIAFLGNYDHDIPMVRLYMVAAFKIILPMMRLFRIHESDIILHRDVSSDENSTCPGQLFDFDRMRMYIKTFKRMKPITRK